MSDPKLSVIVPTTDCYATVRRTMQHLRRQTARDQLEIVLVCPDEATLQPDREALAAFRWVRVVAIGPMTSTAAARAAGARAAVAPVVAFVEEHSFPRPDWAAALLAAHAGPWAAVGPAIGNANPRTALSWANLMIEYAAWVPPVAGGAVEQLPGHNSSYKRAELLKYGERLEAMLDAETILHWDLRACGKQLCLEPAAQTDHFNFSRLVCSLPLRFYGGRLFANARARQWPIGRRLVYILGAPLIPLVRFVRLRSQLGHCGRAERLPKGVWPLIFLLLAVDGFGELVGYAIGSGRAMARLTELEFHRERNLDAADREIFATVS